MLSRLLSILALLAASVPTTAPAEPLQPTAPWVVDYAEAECLAARDYGTHNHLTLVIRPAPLGDTFELLVGRNYGRHIAPEELQGTVDFGKGPRKALVFRYGNGNAWVDQYRISNKDMQAAATATSVVLKASQGGSVELFLSDMPQMLAGLSACTADLLDYWNYTGEKKGTVAQAATVDVRGIFSPDDYPAESLLSGEEGKSQFLLFIDESGKLAACDVIRTSGIPDLDIMGCQVIKRRAHFSPAMDAKGRPMRSTFVTPPIAWEISG